MPYITSAERFGMERGMAQGMAQGMERGHRQGEATVLMRLIERKYGSNAVVAFRERIESADSDTLLEWSERVLSAETVEEVFH